MKLTVHNYCDSAFEAWYKRGRRRVKDAAKAVVKKVSSNEANVSQRSVTYDLYIDGKYVQTYKDINDAIEARDKINAAA